MSFLRYITLLSACQIHGDVALILRKEPVVPDVNWNEEQDFQMIPSGHNWMLDVEQLPIETLFLEDFAPPIAELKAPDIQTSDLLIWWILKEYGGTVADMDIVFLRPLPNIQCDAQVVVFKGYPRPGYIPVSIIQGRPCAGWQNVFDKALQSYAPDNYESCGSVALNQIYEDFVSKSKLGEHIIFPWAGKYPWSSWHKWLFGATSWPEIPKECCGIHWYGGHNQRQNQAIKSEKDLKGGAIPHYVRKLLEWTNHSIPMGTMNENIGS